MNFRATYRLQFHKGFTFGDAEKLVPYLGRLGISHLYSSPILTARAGSMHGYDVVDHAHINPELGGEDGFRALAAALRARDMGILLDIVPNHMAVGGADNPYWLDVLEKGRESIFANMFDIDWEPAQPSLRDKIFVPLLGEKLPQLIENGAIKLVWDARLGKFAFAYAEHRFPLRPDDYELIQGNAEDVATANLARWNEPAALSTLLTKQNFRLAHWRDAGDRINWRRFFDIASLAALRIEDDAVFEQTHAMIFRLYSEGLIDGVRVDHIDGLADPRAYCTRLRARLEALMPQRPESLPRTRPLIFVEKILAEGEELPPNWNVDGTTGYDFMNAVSALQHDARNVNAFTDLWTSISGRTGDFSSEEQEARREILDSAFANALFAAAVSFQHLDNSIDVDEFRSALALLLKHFQAYRTYALGDSEEPAPGLYFETALQAAHAEKSSDALAVIAKTMRGGFAKHGLVAREAVRRFNQLAAPVAAKAVEDTAFYRYGRLLSRNDVGFSPARFSAAPEEVHAGNVERRTHFCASLLATATHDHKRGEDVRARLAVLSEIPEEWERTVRDWFALNAPFLSAEIAGGDEYQLYQTLIGSWPFDLSVDDRDGLENFEQRILQWRQKSLREAKLVTSWSKPNETVEAEHRTFIHDILNPHHEFVNRLQKFVARIAPAGAMNSLAQTVLRCTCPGTPDLYQGAELWDFSLVDPDNRGPVDFETRRQMEHDEPQAFLSNWRSGQVKLALITRLLSLRRQFPDLFARGDYVPVETDNDRVLAFTRFLENTKLFVAVPRLCARNAIERKLPLPNVDYHLPKPHRRGYWRDALDPDLSTWRAAPLFAEFPAAILISDEG